MTLTNDQLSDMTPWTIAEHYGIGYSGDMNPVEHGGIFYDYRDWEEYGYANAVEFWEDPETHHLIVQQGTINKPKDLTGAFRCIGLPVSDNIHEQIEAARSWAGIEVEGTEYPYLKSFNLDTWKERNIWKSIRNWIEALGQ